MRSDLVEIRFLLDEHYPAWLADELSGDGIDAVALNAHRPELRGVDDRRVLQAAVAEGRVVVTEDVSTFSAAITSVPQHVGVVYCHHARLPRTRPGLNQLRKALVKLASSPPDGLGQHPIIWWLANTEWRQVSTGGVHIRRTAVHGSPRRAGIDRRQGPAEIVSQAEHDSHGLAVEAGGPNYEPPVRESAPVSSQVRRTLPTINTPSSNASFSVTGPSPNSPTSTPLCPGSPPNTTRSPACASTPTAPPASADSLAVSPSSDHATDPTTR